VVAYIEHIGTVQQIHYTLYIWKTFYI